MGPKGHVFQDGLVREQVERLEHHSDVGAEAGKLLAFLGQLLAVDGDFAVVDGFEAVDGPAQCGLARA